MQWKNKGKPRIGIEFEEMKTARRNFRQVFNYCKTNDMLIRKEKLLNSFNNSNKTNFWKEVKHISKTKKCINNEIDGENDVKNIANLFKSKYQNILDNPSSQTTPDDYENVIDTYMNNEHINNCKILKYNVIDSIHSLNEGIGHDFIHTKHLKFASDQFINSLSLLFSSYINHAYMPKEMLFGEIRPIIKNKMGNKTDSDNFRPVMNLSNLLKLVNTAYYQN